MADVTEPLSETWGFQEGAEIAPGRTVLQRIGSPSELYDTYLVWDEQRFAIAVAKVIRPDRIEDDSAYRGLEREARALATLQHPIVVRSFDVVRQGPYPHVLLEHLEGYTLRATVHRQGPLPLEQVLPLGLHMASALHYFAAVGWVHLDVKPANIIMSAPPKLIDLSVARTFEECGRIRTLIGTDQFMSPEQCTPGEGASVGTPADVFGLAATLYYACSGGQIPFPRPAREDRHTLADRFPQIADEPVPLGDDVPKPLRQIITRGLSFQPEDRPTAAEFAMAFQPLISQLPHPFVLTKSGWAGRVA